MKNNMDEQMELQGDSCDEAWFVDIEDDELLPAGQPRTSLALWVMMGIGLACYGVLVAVLLR